MNHSLSTRICTHKLAYKDGDIVKTVNLSEQEAQKAIRQWESWKPVSFPNTKDPEKSEMLIAPNRVTEIRRFHR